MMVTADDIVRGGACADGVAEALASLSERGIEISAAMSVAALQRALSADEFEHVRHAIKLDGYGYGYGNGDGYGDGYGNGDGWSYADPE